MCVLTNLRQQIPLQMNNPTNDDRYNQLKYLLAIENRPEDFEYIIEALKPPPDITTLCPNQCGKDVKVAVIGGGAAGLAAAFELKKIGCDTTLFEATNRLGGRILTYFFDEDKNQYADLGAMRIPVSHETSWHYINLFNLNTYPYASSNVNGLFYVRDGRAINDPLGISVMENIYPKFPLTEEEKRTPWFELLGRLTSKYMLDLTPEERQELVLTKPVYSDIIKRMDKYYYKLGFESVGLSQGAIAMLSYLSAFIVDFFNLSLAEMMEKSYTADFSLLYGIEGGVSNLVNSFLSALNGELLDVYSGINKSDLGVSNIRFSTAIDGIYQTDGPNKVTLKVVNTTNNTATFEDFDYVICAIPFSSLRRVDINPLFGYRKMQAITELNYEPAQKVFIYLKNRFWEMGDEATRIIGGSSATDLPIIETVYPSDHATPISGVPYSWTFRPGTSANEPGVLLASYNWGQNASRLGSEPATLRLSDVTRQVEQVHDLPEGFINENLISSFSIMWTNIPYIWTGGCLGKPQDKLLFSYAVTLPEMNNRVFFAGEHISQKHIWIQGALQTGMIAANDVANQIQTRKS
ncbi:NAD(P)/FAD-dependent oxidoreductase [Clostridium sp.]|uniref:flavin monoamine oxidase family protein n=1 Tax=Clostridium sp. TaxID=1506 RepID=UPI002FCC0B1C